MKIISVAFFFILISAGLCAQDCSRLHTGKFSVTDPKTGTTYSIVRDDSTQSEVNLKTGATYIFKVRWLNNCSYGAIPKPNVEKGINPDVPNDMILLVNIVEVKKKYYRTVTTSNKLESPMESKIDILKK